MSFTVDEKALIKRLRFVENLSHRDIATVVCGRATKESSVRKYLASVSDSEETSTVTEHNGTFKKTVLLTNDDVLSVKEYHGCFTEKEVAELFEVPVTTIRKIWDGGIVEGLKTAPGESVDDAIVHCSSLVKKHQKKLDTVRVERKVVRETSRVNVVLEELTRSLVDVFDAYELSALTTSHPTQKDRSMGVIQLSDLHFGERIVEVSDNVFDTSVVCARLKKFADSAKIYFKAMGIDTVLIAMTGDLINSDRRLDEISTNSENRAAVVFTAVDVLQQFIMDINKDFNVTVASICGNESRIGKDYGWANNIASDSFDFIIHHILSRLFVGSKGVTVLPMNDPLESVVAVNGSNFLLIHGHNGLANTARAEMEVAKLKAKYVSRGVCIDYVICGHIHAAYISDTFARSSGLPGANSYSDKGLNLTSRSSQNIYIVHGKGMVDGIKIDLQEFDRNNAYNYNKNAEAYKPINCASNTVIIQSVVI